MFKRFSILLTLTLIALCGWAKPADAAYIEVHSARISADQFELVVSTDVDHSCFILENSNGEIRSALNICFAAGIEQVYSAPLYYAPNLRIYDTLVLRTVLAPIVTSNSFRLDGDLALHSVRLIGGTQVEVVYSLGFAACGFLQDAAGNNLARISSGFCEIGEMTTAVVDREAFFSNIQAGQAVSMSLFLRPDMVTNSVIVGSAPSPLPCTLARETITLLDRGAIIANDIYAGGRITLGADSFMTGNVRGRDDAYLHPRSQINGDLYLIGTVKQGPGIVTGSRFEFTPVAEQFLTASFVLEGETNLTVSWDQTLVLPPGRYGTVTVLDRGKLRLAEASAYSFDRLILSNDAKIQLNTQLGEFNIEVERELVLGHRFVTESFNGGVVDGSKVHFYTNGANLRIPFDSVLRGQVWAPNANVVVEDRAKVHGCVRAKNIQVRFDSRIL